MRYFSHQETEVQTASLDFLLFQKTHTILIKYPNLFYVHKEFEKLWLRGRKHFAEEGLCLSKLQRMVSKTPREV